MSISIVANEERLQDWHPEDIKAELRKRGWSMHQLALANGYKNSSALRQVFSKSFPKAERIISEAVGVSPEVIWPTRKVARELKKIAGVNA